MDRHDDPLRAKFIAKVRQILREHVVPLPQPLTSLDVFRWTYLTAKSLSTPPLDQIEHLLINHYLLAPFACAEWLRLSRRADILALTPAAVLKRIKFHYPIPDIQSKIMAEAATFTIPTACPDVTTAILLLSNLC